jgi:hypothetical protein
MMMIIIIIIECSLPNNTTESLLTHEILGFQDGKKFRLWSFWLYHVISYKITDILDQTEELVWRRRL